MDDKGFIALHRRLIDWRWYKDNNTKAVFIHCLLRANWQDVAYKGVDLKRGQFITSLEKMQEDLGLSQKEVRTALKHLVSTGEVASKATNKYRIITVLNYDKWQVTGKQEASQGQTEGKPGATDNKEKEFKPLEEYSTQKAPSGVAKGASAKKNQFNQFQQSDYGNIEELEKKLLSN
ncbi:MAG: hypothetical protein IJL09_03260 [Lachnospiraceae bacterium]|nr:hypothetical protein [Lachnospiraceae bacterium]